MNSIAAFLYLVSGVLFILALRGLSHPATSRKGNLYGMTGMGIAILTTLTLATPSFGGLVLIVLGLAIGGGVIEADGLGLDGDPALALDVHIVEDLGVAGHLALREAACRLDQPVGEGRLAVVDMRDDAEITDVIDFLHLGGR